jgi:hypothetical protein
MRFLPRVLVGAVGVAVVMLLEVLEEQQLLLVGMVEMDGRVMVLAIPGIFMVAVVEALMLVQQRIVLVEMVV